MSYGFSLLVTQVKGLLFIEVISSHQNTTENSENWTLETMMPLGTQKKDEYIWKGFGKTMGWQMRLQPHTLETKDKLNSIGEARAHSSATGGGGGCVAQGGAGRRRVRWYRRATVSQESDSPEVPQKTALPNLQPRKKGQKMGQGRQGQLENEVPYRVRAACRC